MSNPGTPPSSENIGGGHASSPPGSANTPSTPSPTSPNSASTPNSSEKKRSRGNYNCGKCGLKKRGHVCNIPSGQGESGSTPTKATTANNGPPVVASSELVPAQHSMYPMYPQQSMMTNSSPHPVDQNNNPEVLRNEIEDLKKVIQFLQQQNNDMRSKIYALTVC